MESYYTGLLRQAHLTALKQKYLDAIADAKLKKNRLEEDYRDDTRDAYVARRTDERDAPQRLRALGFGGGVETEELRGILADYESKLNTLARERSRYLEDYGRTVEQQTRLMNNAVAEYNARIALEDYNASQSSAKKSRSSARTSAKASVPQVQSTQLYGPKPSSAKTTSYSIKPLSGRW